MRSDYLVVDNWLSDESAGGAEASSRQKSCNLWAQYGRWTEASEMGGASIGAARLMRTAGASSRSARSIPAGCLSWAVLALAITQSALQGWHAVSLVGLRSITVNVVQPGLIATAMNRRWPMASVLWSFMAVQRHETVEQVASLAHT